MADAGGLVDECGFTVTVVDDDAPVITCPADIVAAASATAPQARLEYAAPRVSDNSGAVLTPSCTPASNSTFALGATSVSCSVADAAGNRASCDFSVRVVDRTAPVLTCPADVRASTSLGVTSASVQLPRTTAEDNVGVAALSCDQRSGVYFLGTPRTVRCTASDAAGNTQTCSYRIVVVDEEAPSIACPVDSFVRELPAGSGSAEASLLEPAVRDNDRVSRVACDPPAGRRAQFGVGVNNVTCTAEDPSGNTASCSYTVEVSAAPAGDQEPLACPSSVSASAGSASTGVIAYEAPANATCSPASGTALAIGEHLVVCRTEAVGSQAADACAFSATVTDEAPPVVTCQSVRQATEPGRASATIDYALPEVEENDGRGVTYDCSAPQGSRVRVGESSVVCSATDFSGNAAECTIDIEVVDEEAPVVTCPPASEAILPFGAANGTAKWPGAVAAVDNVDGNLLLSGVTCTPASGSVVELGDAFEVTCAVRDAAGNEGSCSFDVSVVEGDLDCEGAWSPWSACTFCPQRTQARTFEVEVAPTPNGRQCPEDESRRCVAAPSCLVLGASFTIGPADIDVLQQSAEVLAAFRAEAKAALYSALVRLGVGRFIRRTGVTVTDVRTRATVAAATESPARRRRATDGTVTVSYQVDVESPDQPPVQAAMESLDTNSTAADSLLSDLAGLEYGLGAATDLSHSEVSASGSGDGGSSSGSGSVLVIAVAVAAVAVLVVLVIVVVVVRRRRNRVQDDGYEAGAGKTFAPALPAGRKASVNSSMLASLPKGDANHMGFENPVRARVAILGFLSRGGQGAGSTGADRNPGLVLSCLVVL